MLLPIILTIILVALSIVIYMGISKNSGHSPAALIFSIFLAFALTILIALVIWTSPETIKFFGYVENAYKEAFATLWSLI